jgi:hypothetical protein
MFLAGPGSSATHIFQFKSMLHRPFLRKKKIIGVKKNCNKNYVGRYPDKNHEDPLHWTVDTGDVLEVGLILEYNHG